jgi:hypothetical protein
MARLILKKSAVITDGAPKQPAPGDLEYGELALNYAVGTLYYKKSDNTIGAIGAGASPGNGTLTLQAQAGLTNTSVSIGTGTGFSANTATNTTYQVNVGPALSALAGTMTGAGSGFLRKSGADTYEVDTNTYATASSLVNYLPLAGGTMTGAINMSGTQTLTLAGFAGIEYYNTAGTWEVYIGTENNTGNVRYNSRQGTHTWYANGTSIGSLASTGLSIAGTLTLQGNRLGIKNTAITAGIDSVAGWAYDSTFSVANPVDIFFKPDGLIMYLAFGTSITQYNLSVAWDITTAVAGSTFSMSLIDVSTLGLFISPDGTKMITSGNSGVVIANGSGVAGEDRAYYFTLGTPWDVSTATLVSSIRFAIGDAGGIPAAMTAPQAVDFKNDGTIMYIIDSTTDAVHQFALSSAYNVATATWTKQFSVSGQESGPTGLRFNTAGTRMYVYGSTGDDVNEYRLGTAWDIATAVFYDKFYTGWFEPTPTGIYINESANVAFLCGSSGDVVLKFRTDRQAVEIDAETTTSKIELAGNTRVTNNFYVNGRTVLEGRVDTLGDLVIGGDITVLGNDLVVGSATSSATLFSGLTSGALSIATSETTGAITVGGTAATGVITVGQSTVNQTLNLSSGATTAVSTKVINIGTAGLAGSTSTINIGSTVSGALGVTTIGGTQTIISSTTSAVSTTTGALRVTGGVGIGGNLHVGETITSGGGTLTGDLIINSSGLATSPALRINLSDSGSAFLHAQESIAANLTADQSIIHVLGVAASTKNAGYIGYKYSGTAGSNNNLLTFGHWGSDHLMTLDGGGNLIITGNLTVNGTTTTINSTTVAIDDLNLQLATDAPTAAAANGAGISIGGAGATFTYTSADDRWNLNKNLNVGTVYGALSGNATTATTLQTARNINGTSFNGSANITTANWGTARDITIGGTSRSVNGSAAVTWSIADLVLPDGAERTKQWVVAANGAQGRRHTIGRVYGTPNHWINTWQNIRIKIVQEDWSSGYVDYNLFGYYGMGNGTSWILRLKDADGVNTGYFRVSLGTVTYAGWQYSGQNTYYQDVYIDVDYYTTVRVTATTYGHSYQSTNPTDGTSGCYTVFYDSPSAADIAYVNDDKSSTYHFGDKILNAANYNSYSPTLTGGSASGTWDISISGNAATANALNTGNNYTGNQFTASSSNGYFFANRSVIANQAGIQFQTAGTTNWWNFLDNNSNILAWYQSNTNTQVMTLTQAGVLNVIGGITQNSNQVLHAGNYNSYSPTLTGTGASGTWGINITGNAGSANILGTTRLINGTSFNGSANIDTTEWYHSDRDFPNGTLITTNINYAVSEGDPFVLEIRGNSYGNIIPLDLVYQGYIYADTIINHGGISNGFNITGLVAINNGGNLCFWFPSQGYWNGYNVKVYSAYATRATNRVTSITGVAKPTTAKEVALSANIRQSLHSGNYNSYSPTLTGGGASGTWGINITGSAGSAGSVPWSGITSIPALWYQSGSWLGDLGSNGFTRENGVSMTGGAEFVLLSNGGRGYTLVDGSYYAYENGGFFSSNNSAYGTLLGFYADTTTSLNFNTTSVKLSGNQILHAGNYTNYTVPISHTHSFDSLTSKTGGTGDYMTTGSFIAQNILRVQNGGADWDSLDLNADGATHYINARGAETGLEFQFDGVTRMSLSNAGSLNLPNGGLTALTKSFLIPHPTKPGKKLRYGSLEGPENGVYVRGRLQGTDCIQLPEYWTELVDPDSITVQLTCRGKPQQLYIREVRNNCMWVDIDGAWAADIDCYYFVQAERKDVAKLEVEVEE